MGHKNKTVKALKKRFRVTGTGKLKRNKSGKRHLNSHMTGKRKRQLRGPTLVPDAIAVKYLVAMGEG